MCRVYPTADLFLLATIYDIFGMVLLEAMYFNMSVFTTINGGADMLISDGENGFVFKNFVVEKWCDSISRYLTQREKFSELGNRAHKTVAERFTWDALVDKFVEVYNEKLKEDR